VVDALTKLRDSTTLRLVPALQRLHVILEEVRGWSLMSSTIFCGCLPFADTFAALNSFYLDSTLMILPIACSR
jgi:hypothetical protein